MAKYDSKDEEKNGIKDEKYKLKIDYKNLYNKYEELKTIKENEIRNIVKEIIFDKDIKLKLFKDLEKTSLPKYNLNNMLKNDYQIESINE